MSARTITGLRRWSCQIKELPAVSTIRALHVYDFDNTLFMSPLPNPKLWNGPTLGLLGTEDTFANGGWWHDVRILAATGEGVEREEPRAWEGWWNENIVSLVQLSMRQKDALTVLLTGRSEAGFADLIKRMVASKGLEFDLIGLKPAVGPYNQRFPSTMTFKHAFFEDLIYTYREAEEMRIYEDRPKHVKAFRDYLVVLNKPLLHGPDHVRIRRPIQAEVIPVTENVKNLDPVTETAEVQRMINEHNAAASRSSTSSPYRLQIKRTIFYTGYLISPANTQRLLSLVSLPEGDVKVLANNILITPRPAPQSILDKVGGMGKVVTWAVTATAVWDNRLWAVAVKPVPEDSKYYTENPTPVVVLALRKGARPVDTNRIQPEHWRAIPAHMALTFETVVGEKMLLRVEKEERGENEWESLFASKDHKRKHAHGQGADGETYSGQPRTTRPPGGRGGTRGHAQGFAGRPGRGSGVAGSRGGHRGNNTHRGNNRGGNRGRGRGGAGGASYAPRAYDELGAGPGWHGGEGGGRSQFMPARSDEASSGGPAGFVNHAHAHAHANADAQTFTYRQGA
ncbi:MAG: hypothetical protein M1838_000986 [Thelocarpon superellum]|nr:MAG: hypothetical protein M1838_000986 [Thelocarpon superellum]